MKVYIGADHAGYELKAHLIDGLRERGYAVEDCGAHLYEPDDDYPEIIRTTIKKLLVDLRENADSRAVVIGASGQGEAIVANRFKGIRCALYYGAPRGPQTDSSGHELSMIESTRAHNDCNALSLAARFMTPEEALRSVESWLKTPHSSEDRHTRRIWQIDSA
jgi:ribose 5-phosphate isomerase B